MHVVGASLSGSNTLFIFDTHSPVSIMSSAPALRVEKNINKNKNKFIIFR